MTTTDEGDHDALLAAVIREPDSDFHRHACADWCDENGQPERAEFIRVQVELAQPRWIGFKAGGLYLSLKWDELRRRERELSTLANRTAWSGLPLGMTGLDGAAIIAVDFRRGFIESVWCPLAAWVGGACPRCDGEGHVRHGEYLQNFEACPICHCTGIVGGHGPALVRRHPVREVQVTDKEPTHFTPGRGPSYWRWFDGSRVHRLASDEPEREYDDFPADNDPDELPGSLWRVYDGLVDAAGLTWEHPTREDAHAALSAACLTLARCPLSFTPRP